MNDIVLVAIEQNWEAIRTHKGVMRTIIEVILRDGIDAGDFDRLDVRETSQTIMRSLVAYCHPALVAEGLQEGHDLESESRATVHSPVTRPHTPELTPCLKHRFRMPRC